MSPSKLFTLFSFFAQLKVWFYFYQSVCPLSGQLQLWQVQAVHRRHDNRNWLPAKEEHRLLPLRLRQDGCRVHPTVQQPVLLRYPAGSYSQNISRAQTYAGQCSDVEDVYILLFFPVLFDVALQSFWSSSCFSSVSQLVFSFCDKLFGLMVKDIEAMDASILRGEPATGKKQKVPDHVQSMWFEIYHKIESRG